MIKIVRSLASKDIRSLIRERSNQLLIIISTSFVLVLLAVCANKLDNLHFFSRNVRAVPSCRPLHSSYNHKQYDEYSSTTDLFLSLLTSDRTSSETPESQQQETASAMDVATLLGSMIMNGLPLIGLHDFIFLSDFVNNNMNSDTKAKLLSSPVFRERFINFLEVRSKEFRIVPRNCWTDAFISYLQEASEVTREMNIKLYSSLHEATSKCCDDVWAIIEILPPPTRHPDEDAVLVDDRICSGTGADDPPGSRNTSLWSYLGSYRGKSEVHHGDDVMTAGPSLVIHMRPSSVPDTRSYKWSPLKSGQPPQEFGQLLYFLSGFLSVQLEFQNFLSKGGYGGPEIPTKVFVDADSFPKPASVSQDIAKQLMGAETQEQVVEIVMNSAAQDDSGRSRFKVPLYHRAFPTHKYAQNKFWHTLGSMATVALVLFFALPSAVIASSFQREVAGGQLDVLSTIHGVRAIHSALAWCLCGTCWLLFSFICTFSLFLFILVHTPAVVPALVLLLFGLALSPVALILGSLIKRADTVIVAVPTFVFVSMLPGLLYFDLAFDLQRSMSLELAICLLPPSAATLSLRYMFAYEALGISADWTARAFISNTPLGYFAIMMVLDVFVYSLLAAAAIELFHKRSNRYFTNAIPNNHTYSMKQKTWSSDGNMAAKDTEKHREAVGSTPAATNPGRIHIQTDLHAGEQPPHVSLRVLGLEKVYPSRDGAIKVLADVNAELCFGHVTCLLGSNGAGKTTLMRILGCLDSEHTGYISLHTRLPDNDRAPDSRGGHPSKEIGPATPGALSQQRRAGRAARKRTIGWCPQNDAMFPNLTVLEHINLFQSLMSSQPVSVLSLLVGLLAPNRGRRKELAGQTDTDELLELLGLYKHRGKQAKSLSGGMRRRLSLALALIGEPEVLLLDEPTNGCDSYTRELVRKVILSKRSHCATLISTHHIDDVEILSDRVWFLNDRYLVFDGPLSSITTPIPHVSSSLSSFSLTGSPIRTSRPSDLRGTVINDAEYDQSFSKMSSFGSSTMSPLTNVSVDLGVTHTLLHPTHNIEHSIHSTSQPARYLEFSTWNEDVKRLLREAFGEKCPLETTTGQEPTSQKYSQPQHRNQVSARKTTAASAGGNGRDAGQAVRSATLSVWEIPETSWDEMRALLRLLEEKKIITWSLSSPSTYKALAKMYSVDSAGSAQQRLAPDTLTTAAMRLQNAQTLYTMDSRPTKRSGIASCCRGLYEVFVTTFSHISWLIHTRILEIRTHLPQFLLSQLLIPFLVVLAVTVACRDVQYPRVEITSESIGGLGEILVGYGGSTDLKFVKVDSFRSLREDNRRLESEPSPVTETDGSYHTRRRSITPEIPIQYVPTDFVSTNSGSGTTGVAAGTPRSDSTNKPTAESKLSFSKPHSNSTVPRAVILPDVFIDLERCLHGHVAWRSDTKHSDELFHSLFEEYYRHKVDRWAGFVMDDTIPKWLESTVYIPASSLQLPLKSVLTAIAQAREIFCSNGSYSKHIGHHRRRYNSTTAKTIQPVPTYPMDPLPPYHRISDEADMIETGASNQPQRTLRDAGGIRKRIRRIKSHETNSSIDICSANAPLLHAQLEHIVNDTYIGTDSSVPATIPALKITLTESLFTNVTMLSNVTTDHAAPVFLKEVSAAVYSASTGRLVSNASSLAAISYKLYSHPLPGVNLANPMYLERGYIGSIMIVLYLLITSIVAVRFITFLRGTGMKLQLHITGLSATSYWIGNYICDVAIVFISLGSAAVAIGIGGPPVRSFFMFATPPYSGMKFLSAITRFAFAIVASNYAFSTLSSEQLSSQLLALISTITCGLFLRLYISMQQHSHLMRSLSRVLMAVSPSYAFSSCMLDMFSFYANSVGKSVGILSTGGISEVDSALRALGWQAVIYLVITICIDVSWGRTKSVLVKSLYTIREFLHSARAARVSKGGVSADSESHVRGGGRARSQSISETFSHFMETLHLRSLPSSVSRNAGGSRPPLARPHRGGYGSINPSQDPNHVGSYVYSYPQPGKNTGKLSQTPLTVSPSTPYTPETGGTVPASVSVVEMRDLRGSHQRPKHATRLHSSDGTTPSGGIPIPRGAPHLRMPPTETPFSGSFAKSPSSEATHHLAESILATSPRTQSHDLLHGRDGGGGLGIARRRLSEGNVTVAPVVRGQSSQLQQHRLSAYEQSHAGEGNDDRANSRSSSRPWKEGTSTAPMASLPMVSTHSERSALPTTPFVHTKNLFVEYALRLLPHPIPISSDSSSSASPDPASSSTSAASAAASVPATQTQSYALSNISVDIDAGEKVALIGINGGGKSTFFKTLALAENVPVSGYADVGGEGAVRGRWALGQRGAIGYVPQDGGLPEFLTVKEALELYRGISRSSGHHRRGSYCDEEQEEFDFLSSKYLSYPIHALSGGNKRKLSVILANVNHPKLLLLDEPTSGVDPVAAERIVTYLQGLHPSQGILFSSHRIHECLRVCSRVLMLYNGKLNFDGPMDTFDHLAGLFYQIDITVAVAVAVAREDGEGPNGFGRGEAAIAPVIISSSQNAVLDELSRDMKAIIEAIRDACETREIPHAEGSDAEGGHIRVVQYSDSFMRVTVEKAMYPMSKMWDVMERLCLGLSISKFSFRAIDMEDVLSFMIELAGKS